MDDATNTVQPAGVAAERLLVVNADDFGLSDGVNRGIIEAHDRGVVTSASLMVRQAAAAEAAALAHARPALSVGLHIDLGEWVYRGGAWVEAYRHVDSSDAAAVANEVRAQLRLFLVLCGAHPTHLDSHQHAHRDGAAREVVAALGAELAVPVRHLTAGITYRGDFYGQTGEGESYSEGVSVENLLRVIASLAPGVSEVGCHPGYADGLRSTYAQERETEVRALCDARVSEAIAAAQVRLVSFAAPEVRSMAAQRKR